MKRKAFIYDAVIDGINDLEELVVIENHKRKHLCSGEISIRKEAVSKALGTGFSGFTARDIEVCHNENGQPFVVLYNGAKKTATEHNIDRLHISISHEKEQAIAFAVAE